MYAKSEIKHLNILKLILGIQNDVFPQIYFFLFIKAQWTVIPNVKC